MVSVRFRAQRTVVSTLNRKLVLHNDHDMRFGPYEVTDLEARRYFARGLKTCAPKNCQRTGSCQDVSEIEWYSWISCVPLSKDHRQSEEGRSVKREEDVSIGFLVSHLGDYRIADKNTFIKISINAYLSFIKRAYCRPTGSLSRERTLCSPPICSCSKW